MENKKFKKIVIALVFISILGLLIIKLDIFNKDNIEAFLTEASDLDWKVFMLVLTILMVFFVPLTWFTFIGALLLDFKGYVCILMSALLAAIISFSIGKVFREDISRLLRKINSKRKRPLDLDSISSQMENYGISYIYFIRSVPLTPYTLINYISGISSINFKDYLIGSLIGIIPSETINILFIRSILRAGESLRNLILITSVKILYTIFVVFFHKRTRNSYQY